MDQETVVEAAETHYPGYNDERCVESPVQRVGHYTEVSPEQEGEPGYCSSSPVTPTFTALTDVDPDCLPGYLAPASHQPEPSLYKVAEVDYIPDQDPSSVCDKVPVYEVSDPRLDLATGQVHIHIDLSGSSDPNSEVLNLSGAGHDSSETVLTTYYDMSSSVATMEDTETASGHSAYPYFNGAAASGAGSSSSSPYNLSNRSYADPTSAYNLYSQYYNAAAAYPYGMNFAGSGSSASASGFPTKGEYGSSYYGSYASWTGNPYR